MQKFSGLFLLGVVLFGSAQSWGATDKPIPSFESPLLKGETYRFDPSVRQKPLLMVFWASWCKSCHYETPQIVTLFEKEKNQLDILGVSVDLKREKALAYVDKNQIPYPSVIDSNLKVSKLFQVRGTPTIILVDKKGEIYHRSYRMDQKMIQAIDRLIDSK